MSDFKHKQPLLAVPLIILLTACASPDPDRLAAGQIPAVELMGNTDQPLTQNYNIDAVEYTVKRGDRLSIIAQKVTGSANNWVEIAEFNSIDDPRYLQTGDVLSIPTDLIVDYEGSTTTPIVGYENSTTAPIVGYEGSATAQVVGYGNSTTAPIALQQQTFATPEAQTSSLAIRRSDAVEIPVVVTPININRDFELYPIDPDAPARPQSFRGDEAQIKVIGSYYPKGIYTEPAPYSKLILRAAPGTLFTLDSKVNDWYKIETTAGSGYIRTSDAAIVKKSE